MSSRSRPSRSGFLTDRKQDLIAAPDEDEQDTIISTFSSENVRNRIVFGRILFMLDFILFSAFIVLVTSQTRTPFENTASILKPYESTTSGWLVVCGLLSTSAVILSLGVSAFFNRGSFGIAIIGSLVSLILFGTTFPTKELGANWRLLWLPFGGTVS